jgi:hypothetical protein
MRRYEIQPSRPPTLGLASPLSGYPDIAFLPSGLHPFVFLRDLPVRVVGQQLVSTGVVLCPVFTALAVSLIGRSGIKRARTRARGNRSSDARKREPPPLGRGVAHAAQRQCPYHCCSGRDPLRRLVAYAPHAPHGKGSAVGTAGVCARIAAPRASRRRPGRRGDQPSGSGSAAARRTASPGSSASAGLWK